VAGVPAHRGKAIRDPWNRRLRMRDTGRMCTLTVFRDQGRLLVTMNRDEARFRGPEEPPRLHDAAEAHGPAWLGPIDSDSGGTWMGVNDRGCVACLLNRYAPEDASLARLLPGRRSRGDIIPAVLGRQDEAAALSYIRDNLEPADFGSFTLVLITPTSTQAFEWAHGGGLAEYALASPWDMVTSSALDTAEVLTWRRERFDEWLGNGAPFKSLMPSIHLDRPAGKEGWAALMDRPISATRSITQVQLCLDEGRATMRYWPREDGQVAFGPPTAELGLVVQISANQ